MKKWRFGFDGKRLVVTLAFLVCLGLGQPAQAAEQEVFFPLFGIPRGLLPVAGEVRIAGARSGLVDVDTILDQLIRIDVVGIEALTDKALAMRGSNWVMDEVSVAPAKDRGTLVTVTLENPGSETREGEVDFLVGVPNARVVAAHESEALGFRKVEPQTRSDDTATFVKVPVQLSPGQTKTLSVILQSRRLGPETRALPISAVCFGGAL